MKSAGQIALVFLFVAWVSTGAIKPLQMLGDVLSMMGGATDSIQERVDTPPKPKP